MTPNQHLQYGPISTALREAAADGNAWDLTSDEGQMAMVACRNYRAPMFWYLMPEFDRSLFMLILSEALAEEGL